MADMSREGCCNTFTEFKPATVLASSKACRGDPEGGPNRQKGQQRAGPTAGKGSSCEAPHRAVVRRSGNGTARKLVYTKAAAAAAEGATIVATIAATRLRFCRRQLNLLKVLKLEPHMNTESG